MTLNEEKSPVTARPGPGVSTGPGVQVCICGSGRASVCVCVCVCADRGRVSSLPHTPIQVNTFGRTDSLCQLNSESLDSLRGWGTMATGAWRPVQWL